MELPSLELLQPDVAQVIGILDDAQVVDQSLE